MNQGIFWIAVDSTSAAFKAGEKMGFVIGILLMVAVPVLFLVSLVQLVRTGKRAWLVGLVCTIIPLLAFVGLILFGAYREIVASGKSGGGMSSSTLPSRSPLPAGGVVLPEGGGFSVKLPGNWKLLDGLHEDAGLQAGNLRREEYFIVISETKEDFAGDLREYSDLTAGNMVSALTKGSGGAVRELSLDGMPALQRTISGVADNANVTYLQTVVESDTRFHQVLGWTLKSKESSALPVLREVVDSLKKAVETDF